MFQVLGLEEVRLHSQDVQFHVLPFEPNGIQEEKVGELSLTNSPGYEAVQFHFEIWTELLVVDILMHFMF